MPLTIDPLGLLYQSKKIQERPREVVRYHPRGNSGSGCSQTFVDFDESVVLLRDVIVRFHEASPGFPHHSPELRIREKQVQCRREFLNVTFRHEKTGPAMLNEFGDSSVKSADHWHPLGQCLHEPNRYSFLVSVFPRHAGSQEDVSVTGESHNLFLSPLTYQRYAVAQMEFRNQIGELRS